MFPLITDTPMTSQQIIDAALAMLRIAHIDGARTVEEIELIREFYLGCGGSAPGWPAFETLDHDSGAAPITATDFPDPASRSLLVALCLMTGYADGVLSPAEREGARAVATGIGMDAAAFNHVHALVKDQLIGQMARLPDTESVAAVAAEIG